LHLSYQYRAVDSLGQTIDFRLFVRQDAEAAERFLRKALEGESRELCLAKKSAPSAIRRDSVFVPHSYIQAAPDRP
jgi:transposase-like protein